MEVWEDAAGGKVSGEQARRVLSDLLGEQGHRVTVREFFTGWLSRQAGAVERGTLEFYGKAVSRLLKVLPGGADRPLDGLGVPDLEKWREGEAKVLSVTTVNHHLKCVRMVLKGAVDAGWMRKNPAAELRPLRRSREDEAAVSRRPFTREELERVLAVSPAEWQALVLLGLYTGQRLGDLVARRWSDVEEGAVHFERTQKTGAEVWVPLPQRALAALARVRIPECVWLFPGLHEDVVQKGKGKVNELSRQFAALLAAAGLREAEVYESPKKREMRRAAEVAATGVVSRKRQGQALVFHSLRHNTRTWLEESGAPAAVIDALMGQDARTGRRTYTHIGKDALRRAAEGIHGEGKAER